MNRLVAKGITEIHIPDTDIRFMEYDLLGCPVHALDTATALAILDAYVTASGTYTCIAANPDKAVNCRGDETLQGWLQRADLMIPDGIGVVAAIRMKYGQRIEQLCGVDLMLDIVKHSAKQGYSVFFLGAKEDVNRKVVETLSERFPTLKVAGRINGYFGDEDEESIVQQINASGAQLLFVAMGSPKQESWIDRHREQLKVKWIQGVGGSFDIHSGTVTRAPYVFRRLHLEWLYRNFSHYSRIKRNKLLIRFSGAVAKDLVSEGRVRDY